MEKYLPPPVPRAAEEKEEGRRRFGIRATPGPRAAPWLVFPTGKYGKNQTFYNLSEQPHNQFYRKCIPELSGTSYYQYGSHEGWLIILFDKLDYHYSIWKYGDCILWNPESFETIQLPNMLRFIQKENSTLCDFILSSPPTNPDSMVCFIYAESTDLVICRPRKDKQWRTHKLPIDFTSAQSMFCFKGNLHIICRNNHLVVETKLNIKDEDDESLSVTQFQVRQSNDSKSPLGGIVCGIQTSYVESSDELFKVIQFFEFYNTSEVRDLKVFKMDFNVMEWEQVHSLGDHVLFVGMSTTASCSCTDLDLTRGCVYYTQYQRNMLFKFDLECKTISVSLPCSNLTTPWYSPDWISMPTNFRVAEERRKAKISCNTKDYDEGTNRNHDVCKKSNGDELKQTGAWATLNENVIGLIASYLRPVDSLNFRAACRENRSAIPAAKWKMSSTETLNGTLPPWLVFSRKNDDIYYFTDPMHNCDRFLMNLSEFLFDSTIRFSKGGWLLMSREKTSIFFFNPFTKAIIQLPDFSDKCGYAFYGISFSSLPTASDCKIFAIHDGGLRDMVHLFSISRGEDSWHRGYLFNGRLPSNGKVMHFSPSSNNPVFYDGKFYCLDRHGTLGVFYPESFDWEVLAKPQKPCNSIYESYLVECEQKLLSLFVGQNGKWVRVFRLDLEKEVWVEVKSLWKNMLLISNSSCVSVIAPSTHMENNIYFPRFRDEKIMYFSLDTGKYHFVGGQHSAEDFCNTEEKSWRTEIGRVASNGDFAYSILVKWLMDQKISQNFQSLMAFNVIMCLMLTLEMASLSESCLTIDQIR